MLEKAIADKKASGVVARLAKQARAPAWECVGLLRHPVSHCLSVAATLLQLQLCSAVPCPASMHFLASSHALESFAPPPKQCAVFYRECATLLAASPLNQV